jgi:hypothetical protein
MTSANSCLEGGNLGLSGSVAVDLSRVVVMVLFLFIYTQVLFVSNLAPIAFNR